MFKFIQVKVKAFFFLLQYLNLAVIYYWKNLIIDVYRVLNIPLPAGIYLLKVDNRNTRTRCKICSKLTMKTHDARHRSGVFIVKFEHISHLF